ncbi:unnamed protein product, partial [Cyprideis torosa]
NSSGADSELQLMKVLKVQESGVNALGIVLDPPYVLLATGGDSGTLTLDAIDENLCVVAHEELSDEFACQVTGVHLIRSACGWAYIAVGGDQRLKMFHLSVSGPSENGVPLFSLDLSSTYPSSIPDAQASAVVERSPCADQRRCYVVSVSGIGTQVLCLCERSVSNE